MNDSAMAISRIKRLLEKVKPERIREVEDFVEFLAEKDNQLSGRKKIKKMEGIWEGLGFERIGVAKELHDIRKMSEESILKKTANGIISGHGHNRQIFLEYRPHTGPYFANLVRN
jgi:Protein of unknown function (DUF2281)